MKRRYLLSRIPFLKLKDLFNPNAHIIIYSGFPLSSGHSLKQRYEIGLIRKGEIPSLEEFESSLVAKTYPEAYHRCYTFLRLLQIGKRKDKANHQG